MRMNQREGSSWNDAVHSETAWKSSNKNQVEYTLMQVISFQNNCTGVSLPNGSLEGFSRVLQSIAQ